MPNTTPKKKAATKWVADWGKATAKQVDEAGRATGIPLEERGDALLSVSAALALVQYNDAHPGRKHPTAKWETIKLRDLDIIDPPDVADDEDPTSPDSESA
ncbi:hypothetical protein KGQ20_13910 [Catenulispora sp. NF23]|uniref:hypothetical protein n=1 Tax=Catenulispora pinistramenti TaxID=2705254 RepID=UPI001BA5EC60|nr:hypothetical protein [Catenulispora pinistramenti]MBS2533864.1 hypothetical protein [Catenulispora pinistramenti]